MTELIPRDAVLKAKIVSWYDGTPIEMSSEWKKVINSIPAVAASQPADPVVKADSCQWVTVKPLLWVGGEILVATGADIQITSHIIPADVRDEYEAERAARIRSAITTQPYPRDAVIARLVEAALGAADAIDMAYDAGGDENPHRHSAELRAAIAAAKGGAA